jgi:hypothetical protein
LELYKKYIKPHLKIILGVILGVPILYFCYWVFLIYTFTSSFPNPHDVQLNKAEATALKDDFLSYGKIFEMDDATRCHKSINNESLKLYDFSDSDQDLCNQYGKELDEILTEYDIQKATYLDFRLRLEQTKLRTYCYEKEKNLFITDGFLDSSWGYLYSDSTLTNEDDYFQMCGRTIKVVEMMGDNWYRIGGT